MARSTPSAALTIDGNCDVPSACFNVSGVALKVNGSYQMASSVVRAVYGQAVRSFRLRRQRGRREHLHLCQSGQHDRQLPQRPHERDRGVCQRARRAGTRHLGLFGAGLLAVGRLARQRRA